MVKRNMSDLIEAYLKKYLKNSEQLEIKRSDIAERFDCVPSQINYVINTRFTQEHGYLVESKRGGGGYIRILKIELVDEVSSIDQMIELIGQSINYRNAINMIETLVSHDIMTERESVLISSIINRETLSPITDKEGELRAYLLTNFLQQLRYIY